MSTQIYCLYCFSSFKQSSRLSKSFVIKTPDKDSLNSPKSTPLAEIIPIGTFCSPAALNEAKKLAITSKGSRISNKTDFQFLINSFRLAITKGFVLLIIPPPSSGISFPVGHFLSCLFFSSFLHNYNNPLQQ